MAPSYRNIFIWSLRFNRESFVSLYRHSLLLQLSVPPHRTVHCCLRSPLVLNWTLHPQQGQGVKCQLWCGPRQECSKKHCIWIFKTFCQRTSNAFRLVFDHRTPSWLTNMLFICLCHAIAQGDCDPRLQLKHWASCRETGRHVLIPVTCILPL